MINELRRQLEKTLFSDNSSVYTPPDKTYELPQELQVEFIKEPKNYNMQDIFKVFM